ncbi:MAG TPA: hypothetical protein VIY66_00120 [Candidatus Acidoferrales bacterium]
MNRRNNTARILVALGAVVLIAASLLHLSDYSKDLSAVNASNLRAGLKDGVRSLYFSFGWESIAIAIIMLISAFAVTKLGKAIVLFCGFALLVDLAVTVASMGWFVGPEMVLVSALLAICGGLLFQNTAA